MSGIVIGLVVIGAVVFLLALWVAGVYNALVRLRNAVKNAWSQIDVQLKRRYDLIPNLVETVKGYASHEKEVFLKVTEARSAVMHSTSVQDRVQSENALTQSLRSLFAVAENYPELKANENFLDLQKQLAAVEDDIQMSRRYYNGAAREFNVGIEKFPNILVARNLGYQKAPYFEAEEQDRVVPKVSF